MDDSLHRRGQALEDLFFQQRDRMLLDRLRKEIADKQARDSLAHVSGISNERVLHALVQQGIAAGTLVCLTMVPLVAVAWADGDIQEPEREAILRSAADNGIRQDSAAFALLASWLQTKPEKELLEAWKLYVTSLRCTLDAPAYGHVSSTIIDRATNVAQAAGGILGMGAISVTERKVLDDLTAAMGV